MASRSVRICSAQHLLLAGWPACFSRLDGTSRPFITVVLFYFAGLLAAEPARRTAGDSLLYWHFVDSVWVVVFLVVYVIGCLKWRNDERSEINSRCPRADGAAFPLCWRLD